MLSIEQRNWGPQLNLNRSGCAAQSRGNINELQILLLILVACFPFGWQLKNIHKKLSGCIRVSSPINFAMFSIFEYKIQEGRTAAGCRRLPHKVHWPSAGSIRSIRHEHRKGTTVRPLSSSVHVACSVTHWTLHAAAPNWDSSVLCVWLQRPQNFHVSLFAQRIVHFNHNQYLIYASAGLGQA